MGASVLTNSSAMIALQNLRSTNKDLAQVNQQISTGKKVATAKDSAAVFAISKIMESDVAGFKALNESLNLGESTVSVASNAAASIGDLLTEIKGKIIAANEDNVDRQALQDEIVSLRDQVTSIVNSAQFNGLNLINGDIEGAGNTFDVLASLNRDSSGNVTTGNITFDPTNSNLSAASGTDLVTGTNPGAASLSVNTAAFAAATVGDLNGLTSADIGNIVGANAFGLDTVTAGGTAGLGQAGQANSFDIGGFTFVDAAGTGTQAFALDADEVDVNGANLQDALIAGDKITIAVGFTVAEYTVQAGDTSDDVAVGMRSALIEAGLNTDDFTIDTTTTGGDFTVTNDTNQEVNGYYAITRAAGGLAGLDTIDVTSAAGAASATTQIEIFIQNAVDAQAALGTIEKRLDIQNDFTTSLIDSFKSGIGALVDADLEEASARLQALQVQQQLGVQALSIANQGPQNILALFR